MKHGKDELNATIADLAVRNTMLHERIDELKKMVGEQHDIIDRAQAEKARLNLEIERLKMKIHELEKQLLIVIAESS